MDILSGIELNRYREGALHTTRIPRTVYMNKKEDLFEAVESHNRKLANDFAQRRGGLQKLSGFSSSAGGGDVFAAIPRFYSPLEYFEQTQIPYDINNKKHRFELYKWLDLFYRTHYLIPILVDIFTRFPLAGIDFFGPDESLNSFYKDLFFDRLDYQQFLVDLGREYWTLGQSFPMGHFNETLGVWEEEELLDPTLIEIKRFPIIGGEEFFIVPPKELVDLVKNKRPRPQYFLLQKNYPEMLPFLQNGRQIPISGVLLKQVAFKASPRDLYGTPILLRALRTLMHEEKLMASQDAIAERLYSPFILAKLGIQEMGANRTPWVPSANDIASFRNDLDIALSSDFRLMVHHFAVDVQNVFGREQMPRLDTDFDRIERRIMQCVSGDTLIHTKDGVFAAQELEGKTIETLSKDGIYRLAEWKNYGKQELYEVILENGDVIRATEFHKWLICQPNGKHKWKLTPELEGEKIPIQHYDSFDYDVVEWEEGVRHGLVNGDGWLYFDKKYSKIRQYSDNKHLLEDYFDKPKEVSIKDGRNYLEVVRLPAKYKTDLPFGEKPSYLRGFIAGLIAADGCVDDTGHVTLHSNDREKLEEIRKLCKFAGVPTIKISSSITYKKRKTPGSKIPANYVMYKLSFVKAGFLTKDDVDEKLILKKSHRLLMRNSGIKRKRYSAKVVAVLRTGIFEDTYCCAESETHTFVIDNNYITGNTFGINPNLLSGGNASTPYASSALQAEFLNQILKTYQNYLIKHYKQRALIVAEAQQHYAYEKRGDTRVPIMEEVLIYDDEGNPRIEKRHKLMIPEMRMKVLDLRDEATQRNFLQAIKQQGVPIPDQDLAMGMHYVFREALQKTGEELIEKTVEQQRAKMRAYDILVAEGLPIPPELLAEMQNAGIAPPSPAGAGGMPGGAPMGGGGPGGPGGSPGGGMGGGPGQGVMMPPAPPGIGGVNPNRGRPDQSAEGQQMSQLLPKGPLVPGVPGQQNVLGIPGGASPAIGEAGGPSGGPGGFRHTKTDKETIHTLPRIVKEGFSIDKLSELDSEDLEDLFPEA